MSPNAGAGSHPMSINKLWRSNPYLTYGWIEGIGQVLVNTVSQDFFISFLLTFRLGTKVRKDLDDTGEHCSNKTNIVEEKILLQNIPHIIFPGRNMSISQKLELILE